MKGDVRIVRFKSSVAAKAAWAGRRNAAIATATSPACRASGDLKRFRMGDTRRLSDLPRIGFPLQPQRSSLYESLPRPLRGPPRAAERRRRVGAWRESGAYE